MTFKDLTPIEQAIRPHPAAEWLYQAQQRIREFTHQATLPAFAKEDWIAPFLNILGTELQVNRCVFFRLAIDSRILFVESEYLAVPDNPSLQGFILSPKQYPALHELLQKPDFSHFSNVLHHPEIQAEPAVMQWFQQWAIQSAIICPILGANHKTAGILMIQQDSPHVWSPEQRSFVMTVVDQMMLVQLRKNVMGNALGKEAYHSIPLSDPLSGNREQPASVESQNRYSLMLQGTNDALWDWDIMTGERQWSERFYEILGLDPAIHKPSGELIWQLMHPDDLPLVAKAVQDLLEHNKKYEIEIRIQHTSGKYKHVLSRGYCSRDRNGNPVWVTGALTDITEWVQAKQIVLESEERFRTMADSSPVIIYVSDLEGTSYVNKTCLEFFGAELEDIYGKQWQRFIHPDDLTAFQQHCENAAQGLEIFKAEARARMHNGEYRWLLITGAPRILVNGEFTGYVGVAIDITDQKTAQEELIHYAEQLQHSNKELEQFATLASHDLQEPLRKVMLFSQYLKETQEETLTEEALNYLMRIQKATDRMRALITDLLDLSRINRNGQPFRKVHLNEVLSTVIDNLRFSIQDTQGKIEVGELMILDADFRQMQQLFHNLIENSLKFHRPSIQPLIQVSAQLLNHQVVEISIQDNGIGFEEKYLERIFGVFERLHGQNEYTGTGIGLALCQKIVRRHKGNITALSQPGQGATFIVTLPLSQG